MYSSAIIKEVNEILTINLLSLSIIISTLVSLLVFFILGITQFLNVFEININFIIYLPILILLFGLSSSISSWLQRCEKVKELSILAVVNSAFTNLFTLGFGYYKFGYKGFIYSMIFGQLLYVISVGYYFLKFNNLNFSYVRPKYIFLAAKKHSDFPRYNLLLGIFDGLSDNLIVYSISIFFGSSVLGQYSFAKNLVMRPLQLIVSSVNNLYYRRLTIMKFKKEDYYLFTKKLLTVLVLIIVPFFLVLVILGRNLFSLLFGPSWKLASIIAIILFPKIFVNYVNGSISSTPLVFNQLKLNSLYSSLNNLLPIFLFFIVSFYFQNYFTSFLSYSVSSFILGGVIFKWYVNLLRGSL
jgi:O-antigen/teichoic acid export membrane protein